MKIRNVLSLFDGISCGQVALRRAGIIYDKYYASEIEKQPIWVTQYNFPDTIQLGDVEKWKEWDIDWSKIDLLIGGSPCFVAGTLVMTDTGMKPIEKIKIGDYVLTHKGRMRKVLNIGNKLSDTIYKISGYGFKNILTTSNHPFYSRSLYRKYVAHNVAYKRCFTEPQWVKCEDLNKNSYLATTYNKCFIENRKFNSDFWYFVGRFIGDGWVRKSKRKYRKNSFTYQTVLCCGKDEFYEVKNMMDKLGYNYNWSEERTVFKFRICSEKLEEYLRQIGIGANNKHVHPDVWNLPKECKKAVIEGYLSADGYFDKNKHSYTYTTISKQLAYEMKLLITEVYNVPVEVNYYDSRRDGIIEGRNVKYNPIFYCRFKLDKRKQDKAFFEDIISWQPFKKCEIINKPTIVYNLEVEEDNSYMADSIIVHNCTNLSIAGNRKGLEGEQSRLFYAYVDILNHIKKFNPDVKFLLENVESMSDTDKGIINKHLGCKPIMINSSLVSAQNRKRYYWFNWCLRTVGLFGTPVCDIPLPHDKHILLKDILESGVGYLDKSETLTASYDGAVLWNILERHQRTMIAEPVPCALRNRGEGKQPEFNKTDKANSLTTVQTDSMICEPLNNFVKEKYEKFANEKGYIPEMFNPYNQSEIKDKAPTLSTQCGSTTSSSSVMVFDKVDKSDISISYFRNFGSKGKILSEKEEKSPTLVAAGGCGGGNVPAIAKKVKIDNKYYDFYEGDRKEQTDLEYVGGVVSGREKWINNEKNNSRNFSQGNRIYSVRGKSVCLNANSGGLGGKTGLYQINLPDGDYIIRKLTPIECERLQTLKDNYTEFGFDGTKKVKISKSARYKALGNGWTVDVISYILKFLV